MTEPTGVRPRNVRLIARVVCRFSDGAPRTFYATRLTPDSVSLLALEPPPVGEYLVLIIHPLGQRPLPPLYAKVTRARVDFAVGEWNYFEASFVGASEADVDRVVSAIIGIDDLRRAPPAFVERRGALRVTTVLPVLAETPTGKWRGILADLSLSGALLCLPKETPEGISGFDAPVNLTIACAPPSSSVHVASRVAWSTVGPSQRLVGVRFVECDASTYAFLQEIILNTLTTAAEARLRAPPSTSRGDSEPPPSSWRRARGGGSAA